MLMLEDAALAARVPKSPVPTMDRPMDHSSRCLLRELPHRHAGHPGFLAQPFSPGA